MIPSTLGRRGAGRGRGRGRGASKACVTRGRGLAGAPPPKACVIGAGPEAGRVKGPRHSWAGQERGGRAAGRI